MHLIITFYVIMKKAFIPVKHFENCISKKSVRDYQKKRVAYREVFYCGRQQNPRTTKSTMESRNDHFLKSYYTPSCVVCHSTIYKNSRKPKRSAASRQFRGRGTSERENAFTRSTVDRFFFLSPPPLPPAPAIVRKPRKTAISLKLERFANLQR